MQGREVAILVGALLVAILAGGWVFHLMATREAASEARSAAARAEAEERANQDGERELQPDPEPDVLTLRLVLSRRHADDPSRAHTEIRLEGTPDPFALPQGGMGHSAESKRAYESVWFALEGVLRQHIADAAPKPAEVKGIATTGPPDGKMVPLTDVARAMQAFTRAGITDFVVRSGEQDR